MADRQTCPRRISDFGPWERTEGLDTWRSQGGIIGQEKIGPGCSFCGSLHPDRFMELVRDNWIVGPTDKSYKCQPPGTMVRVVTSANRGGHSRAQSEDRPIEDIRAGDRVITYSAPDWQFLRNGREVLQVGQRPYSGELIRVDAGGHTSRYTPEHICLVHLADAFRGYHVYAMRCGTAFRIGRCRGWSATQKAPGILYRARTEGADAVWILGTHEDQQDASLQEAYLSWRYGLPGVTFKAANTSVLLDQSALDRFWGSVGDLTSAGKAILADHGRDERFPMWEPNSGRGFWRTRAVRMRAVNLLDGMEMLSAEGKRLPAAVSRETYEGPVYSLAVAREETYIADGLVTHNCYLRQPVTEEQKAVRKAAWMAGGYGSIAQAIRELGEKDGKTPEQITADLEDHWNRLEAPLADSRGQEAKFYYQHLSGDQKREFVDLYNARTMRVGYPGHFYSLPYFMTYDGG